MRRRDDPDRLDWRLAWALAVTQTVGYGVLYYTYSVMTLPMEAELGLSRSQTSGAFSVGLLLSGLAAVPVGRWVDVRGARWLMSLGSAAGALLVLAWSFVTDLPSLYLVQAGIGVVMAAVLYDVAFTVIAKAFRRQRMRAMLIVTTVAGLASTVFVPLGTWLVEARGWREALRYLALVLGALTVPLHAWAVKGRVGVRLSDRLRDRLSDRLKDGATVSREQASSAAGSSEAHTGDVRAVLRSGAFWWVAVAFTLDRLAIVAVAVHSVPLLLERGYAPGAVAAAVGTIGLMQVAGRLLFAPAAGAGSLRNLTALTFAVRAASLCLLLLVPGGAGLWLFAALFGAANGASTLARAGLVADSFGTANYGSINGAMTMLIATVQTASPLAVGAMRVATGSYRLALYVLVGLTLLAALAVMRAGSVTREALPLARR